MPRFDMLNTQYLDRLREAGVAARGDRLRDVHASARRSRRLEHAGCENGKWVPTFPNARYVMSRTDHDHWAAVAKRPGTEVVPGQYLQRLRCCRSSRRRRRSSCSGEHAMCGCFTLKPAPGHTPGQIRLDLESRGKRAIFPGDALHNPVQVPLWKWNSRFCEDRDLARQTRNTLLGDCVGAGRVADAGTFRAAARRLREGQGRPLRARLGLRQRARPLKASKSLGRRRRALESRIAEPAGLPLSGRWRG